MLAFAFTPKHLKRTFIALAIVSLVFVFSFVLVALAYSGNAVYLKATLGDADISGMTEDDILSYVTNHVDELKSIPFVVRVQDSKYRFLPEDLGIVYDKEKTLELIFNSRGIGVGYYFDVVQNLFREKQFDVVAYFDRKVAHNTLFDTIDGLQRPKNAEIVLDNGNWVINPSSIGYVGDTDVILESIQNLLRVDGKRELAFEVRQYHPDFSTQDAEELMPDVERLTKNKHTLIVQSSDGEKRVPMSFRDSQNWLVITRTNDEDWQVSLNQARIVQKLIDEVAPLIERRVQHVEITDFVRKGGRLFVEATGIAQDGIEVDLTGTFNSIVGNIENNVNETKVIAEYVLANVITPPDSPITFPDRVGSGISNYATSSNERIFNIKMGLGKFHNRVLAPGEVFSFNDHVMPITNSAGYKNELAIFGGGGLKKVPGGGLCQVSTTAYRAFFNGGFDILERYPHSLYVHYYTAYQDGLDATIYPGYGDWRGKNLRIKNDYPGYVLVQTYTNDETLDAVVQLFGTTDGRLVELDGPHYLSSTWLDTEYVEDPDMAAGEEYVEIKGVPGKSILWNRAITYADGEVKEEEVYSNYSAKKRVVRVGAASHGVP
jgi:vancomycin resistance protein YoaR